MGREKIGRLIKKYIKGMRPITINVNQVTVAPSELLYGKAAIVTGASRGIGKAIAKAFASSGATVIGIATSAENLNNVKKELGSERFIPYACDVSKAEETKKHFDEICAMVPGKEITILVNCAGVKNGNDERFFEFTPQEFDHVINTNMKGVFFWCQAFSDHLIKKGLGGHIVNVASIKGFIGEASPYGLSKWGCVGLTKGLARILVPKGIIVNGVAPGGTATDMANYKGSDSMLHLATPSMRLAKPEEIANVVLFLASDLGNNIVGDIIVSDGGQILGNKDCID